MLKKINWNRITFFQTALTVSVIIGIIIWVLPTLRPSLSDIAVEFHGMIFDVILFGLVLTYFEQRLKKRFEEEEQQQQRQERIERWKEEIDDYRGWDEKEAMYRIRGNIKRLRQEGVEELDLSLCYLQGAYLQGVNLQKANLQGADLQGADLQEANFVGAYLQGAELQGADLLGAELQGAYLQEANFLAARLQEANLQGANLQGANFVAASLQKAIALESQREALITAGVMEEMLNQINWVAG